MLIVQQPNFKAINDGGANASRLLRIPLLTYLIKILRQDGCSIGNFSINSGNSRSKFVVCEGGVRNKNFLRLPFELRLRFNVWKRVGLTEDRDERLDG